MGIKMEIGLSNCEHTFYWLMHPISLTWQRKMQREMICSRRDGERFVKVLSREYRFAMEKRAIQKSRVLHRARCNLSQIK